MATISDDVTAYEALETQYRKHQQCMLEHKKCEGYCEWCAEQHAYDHRGDAPCAEE